MLALDLGPAAEFALESGLLAADAGGGLRIIPEVGLGGLSVEVLEFSGQPGEVKDAPGAR